ncbi:RNA polymerase sigma factor [Kallotenue papyrolyticum]|uniref:RNA polymerase sigma factor n=1 Tax=Kallotenue papyrolyticum TaxID=1325125 RepID=UPI000492D8D0|nr:RNA polymerase sigma factor [Kallotenue papyrolyticum]
MEQQTTTILPATEVRQALRGADRQRAINLLLAQLDGLYRFVARQIRYYQALGRLQPDDLDPVAVVDEVMIEALRRSEQIPRRASLRGWLRLLALRVLQRELRRIRRRRRHEVVSLEQPLSPAQEWDAFYQPDAALTWADVLPSPEPSPEEVTLRHETQEELEQALNRLPEVQRMVFILRAMEGLSYAEIAAMLHRPASHVRELYHAARSALARQLAPSAGGGDTHDR